MNVTTYTVQGMTCGHCVSTVKTAAGSVPGAHGVEVDLAAGTVTVTGTQSDTAVAQAVSAAGYEVLGSGAAADGRKSLPLDGGGCGCGCG